MIYVHNLQENLETHFWYSPRFPDFTVRPFPDFASWFPPTLVIVIAALEEFHGHTLLRGLLRCNKEMKIQQKKIRKTEMNYPSKNWNAIPFLGKGDLPGALIWALWVFLLTGSMCLEMFIA